MRRAALFLVLAAAAAPAHGFESQCRDDDGGQLPRDTAGIAASICQSAITSSECDPGMPYARGAQLGEHTMIARMGMRWAGIPDALLDDPQPVRYFTDGKQVFGVDTLEPAATGSMAFGVNMSGVTAAQNRTRKITIPEFAQAPDGSFGLADFLSGNEHCLLTPSLGADATTLNACHTFAAHMSVVNANHFSPQSREMHRLYHDAAMQVARRCKSMQTAFAAATTHPFQAEPMDQMVRECERESLILEAAAAHFIGDGWSAGHMWQRWGSPLYPTGGVEGYLRAHMVGAVSGLIHGWRSVVRGKAFLRLPPFNAGSNQHDQLCMPGPFEDWPPATWRDHRDELVTFNYPGESVSLASPAGGDLYLMPCTARDDAQIWSVAPAGADRSLPYDPNHPLARQYRRMLTCVARSAAEVYDAGPKLEGDRRQNVPASQLDDAIPLPNPSYDAGALSAACAADPDGTGCDHTGVRSDLCWNQRMTNRSMLMGAGISQQGSFAEPHFLARVTIDVVPDVAEAMGDPSKLTLIKSLLPAYNPRLRVMLGEMGLLMQQRAARAPDALDIAQMSPRGYNGMLQEFLGNKRNSEYLGELRGNQVPYLESRKVSDWSDQTVDFADPSHDCSGDAECQAANPRTYCDRGAIWNGQHRPRCVPVEAPVLRAFRGGEAPYWCHADDWSELRLARDACKGKAASSAECQACVQVVRPHLRDACDPGVEGWPKTLDGHDTSSICDVLRTGRVLTGPQAELAVNVPYEPRGAETWPQAAERATMQACQDGSEPAAQNAHAYGFDANPPAVAKIVDPPYVGSTFTRAMCGLGTGQHWFRFAFNDPTMASGRSFRLRLEPVIPLYAYQDSVDKVELAMFAGPACTQLIRVAPAGTDTNTDMVPDYKELAWNPATDGMDVCFRVKALERTVRSGYTAEFHWF